MSTEPITRAIARTLKEATNGFLNGFLNESIYSIPLQEEAPNAYPNSTEVGTNYEGKAAYFVLEIKGGKEAQTFTF